MDALSIWGLVGSRNDPQLARLAAFAPAQKRTLVQSRLRPGSNGLLD